MKVYLVRHGQATIDIDDQYGGEREDSSTALEKNRLPCWLINSLTKVSRCSTLVRITAEIVSERMHVSVVVVNDIRERNRYGIFAGMNKDEAELHLELVELVRNWKSSITGCESYVDYCTRAQRGIEAIVQSSNQTIALMVDGGYLRFILWKALDQEYYEISTADCAAIEARYEDGAVTILSMGGIANNKYK